MADLNSQERAVGTGCPGRMSPGVVPLGGLVLYAGMARATDGEHTTSEDGPERGLLDYLHILWRHKLVIALTVVVATGAAVGLDHFRTRTYQGTAEVLFTFQGTSGLSSSSDLSPADVATDIELIQSAPVQAAVAQKLQTTAPPFTATEVGTTNVARIAVQSTSHTSRQRRQRVRPAVHPVRNPGLHQITARCRAADSDADARPAGTHQRDLGDSR